MTRRPQGFWSALLLGVVLGSSGALFAAVFEALLINGRVYSTRLESLLPLFHVIAWPGYEIPEALGWMVVLNSPHIRGLDLFENFLVFGGTIFLYWLLFGLVTWSAFFALVKLSRRVLRRIRSR